ncbi:unnamed protein product, partial [Heligmosomoides polygyrus]|uniref:EGF-like domain-containing protein n=1 Tax=Heligmosomoides polygyrus TaxID=6339 RepID=A0A183FBL9_HELPZ
MKICTLGVACDCAHACTFEEDEEGAVTSKCYCHSGFVLTEDQKSCEPTSDAPSTFSVVRVTPPAFTTEAQPEEIAAKGLSGTMPAKIDGSMATSEGIQSTGRPTDSSGRQLPIVVGPDGTPLQINDKGEILDYNRKPITIADNGTPLDPLGEPLPRNKEGAWIYPLVDKTGKPLPVDDHNVPKITVIDAKGVEIVPDENGRLVGEDGRMISTDAIGRPLDQHGEPYELNEDGKFVVDFSEDEPSIEDDEVPDIPLLVVDGEPLDVDDNGHFIDSTGAIIPMNEEGIPIDEEGIPLNKNQEGKYVLPPKRLGKGEPTEDFLPHPTDESGRVIFPIISQDGSPLPTVDTGEFVTVEGTIIERDDEGRPLGPDGEVLPTDSSGNFVYP